MEYLIKYFFTTMSILLVGCTGFLGEALLYKLLRETDRELILVIRSKDNKSIETRICEIFDSIKLDYTQYIKRIKLVNVSYDDCRNIAISAEDDKYIKKNTEILVNALADVHMNRELKKAALNNTVTALQWMQKFQECKKGKKYIFISTAFVNFHRIEDGEIPEEILEKNMTQKTLDDILDLKQTTIDKYENTYVYTKQLAEVLLCDTKKEKQLIIIRPSIIIPALEAPYPGWGKLQTISYIILGMGSGILSLLRYKKDGNQNTVPVDIVAEDCLMSINYDHNDPLEIRHICLTGNVKTWFSKESTDIIHDRAYDYFIVNPLILNNKRLFPRKIDFKRGWWHLFVTFIAHLIRMVYHWWKWSDSWSDFFRILYKTMVFTYKFDRNLTKFSHKKIVFKRERKDNDINYPTVAFEDCYYEFVKNFQNIISSDTKIINMFF
jgi:nucleoside-diphosphate-sugar epimerase